MTNEIKLEKTPLQRVFGFEVAEETYDMLPITAQCIIDLLIEGYTQQDIADVLGIGQSTVNDTIRRIRYTLLKSKMHLILEARIHYRESTPLVPEEQEK